MTRELVRRQTCKKHPDFVEPLTGWNVLLLFAVVYLSPLPFLYRITVLREKTKVVLPVSQPSIIFLTLKIVDNAAGKAELHRPKN